MRKIEVLISIMIMFVCVGILGCKEKSHPRPAGVPQSAIWAGGEDGGVFVDCVPSEGEKPNSCKVYNEFTGDVYMSGRFVVQGLERGANKEELKYRFADGSNIYLAKDLILIPVQVGGSGAERMK